MVENSKHFRALCCKILDFIIDIKIKPSELLILEHKTTKGQRTVLLRTVISRWCPILDIFNSKYFEAT